MSDTVEISQGDGIESLNGATGSKLFFVFT